MQLGLIDKKGFQNQKELGKGNLPVYLYMLETQCDIPKMCMQFVMQTKSIFPGLKYTPITINNL